MAYKQLWHRHRLVQMRTRIMNQLQAVAMNEGLRRKRALWSESGRKQLESRFVDASQVFGGKRVVWLSDKLQSDGLDALFGTVCSHTVNPVWMIRRLYWHDAIHRTNSNETRSRFQRIRLIFKEAPL